LLATAVLLGVLAWPCVARAQRRISAPGSTILVNADEELAGYLRKAKEAIDEKDYETAIDILHALITRTKAGFAPTEEKGRFVALRLRAAEMIRRMPPEGLSLYRSIYDPQARRLFEEALRTGQLAPMRLIVSRYANTSVGPLAQETLASLYHDRGRFSQAAHAFRVAAELYGDDPRAAVLQGRAAIAYHLSGDRNRGRSLLQTLSKRSHGQQEVRWGGERQRLDRLVADVLSREVEQEHVAIAREGWPGLTAFPGGIARMQPSDVVLMPRWTRPSQAGRSGDEATLVAMSALFNDYMRVRHRSRGRIGRLYHKGGAVLTNIRSTSRGRQSNKGASPLPGIIHPLVVGDLVIYRTDEAVVAVDRSTGYTWEGGKAGWKSFDLPISRAISIPAGHSSSSYVYLRDLGRHRLSMGAGKVYALYGFRPPVGRYYHRRTRQKRPEPDSSGLAALSLNSQNKII
jgi:tetratricopeptide (TPR) repeat protein